MFRSQPVAIGDRVVVRRRLPDGTANHLGDIIGHVVSTHPLKLRPQLVGGLVSTAEPILIPDEQIQVLRKLSPRRVRNSDIRAVEVATAKAFPGIEHTWSRDGQWLLRAGDGITERSNSAVPLGRSAGFSPVPMAEIRAFYERHQLPIRLLVPERIGAAAEKLPGDWELGPEIIVMTRSLADLSDLPTTAGPAGLQVSVDKQPDDEWRSLYHFRGQQLPRQALELLRREIDGEMGFGRLRDHGATVAITRGTLTRSEDGREWLGYSAVEVAATYRRRGLGTRLGADMLRWGASHQATDAYLQVVASNEAGINLYRKLGFIEHHRHRAMTLRSTIDR